MIKLTVKEMRKKKVEEDKTGVEIKLQAEKASPIEFMSAIVSTIRAYQQTMLEECDEIISDRQVIKEIKFMMKKAESVIVEESKDNE